VFSMTAKVIIIHTTNTRCVLYIKAGAASKAGAWFIQWPVQQVWPVRGLYGPDGT